MRPTLHVNPNLGNFSNQEALSTWLEPLL